MNDVTVTAWDGLTYHRISKTKARKIFNELGIAFAAPVKANIGSVAIPQPCMLRYNENDERDRSEQFETWSRNLMLCHHWGQLGSGCSYGRYLAYYEVIA